MASLLDALLDDALSDTRTAEDLPGQEDARAVRESAGLTQEQLGEIVGVDRATVCRWERGERRPRGVNLRLYSAVLRRLTSLSTRAM